MVALFDYITVFHNKYKVGVSYSGKSVCYYKAGFTFHEFFKSFLDLYFSTDIYVTCCFIKYEHRWICEHYTGYDEKLFLHLQPVALDVMRSDLEEMARTECEGLHVCTSVVALHLILRLCGLAMEAPQAASAEILEVMSYIRAHPDADLTLPALAKTARMSRSTFCRQFEKIVRISPGEYVRRCRTELARRMLAEGKENRTEIALSCGFYDLSHMNRCLQAEKRE